jgi:hypothetical protein
VACFVGSAWAFILPAHFVLAALAIVGIGSVWIIHGIRSIATTGHLPTIGPVWRRAYVAAGTAIVLSAAWGLLTGHGFVTGLDAPSVSPFNDFWREAVATTILGAGVFLAIGIAWFMVGRERPTEANLYLGTTGLVLTGTLVWGARLGDLNTIHLFFGGIAFATPVAAVAVWSVLQRLSKTGHERSAAAVIVLSGVQLVLGVAVSLLVLQGFGPPPNTTVPVRFLAEIESLPSDAKLAYACRPFEESSFWNPRLLGLEAHTGRRIVPMCFEAETLGVLTGGQLSSAVPSTAFGWAPQAALYPDADARPSSASVAAFLKANRIDYIFADGMHRNTLAPDAVPIVAIGDSEFLRLR